MNIIINSFNSISLWYNVKHQWQLVENKSKFTWYLKIRKWDTLVHPYTYTHIFLTNCWLGLKGSQRTFIFWLIESQIGAESSLCWSLLADCSSVLCVRIVVLVMLWCCVVLWCCNTEEKPVEAILRFISFTHTITAPNISHICWKTKNILTNPATPA